MIVGILIGAVLLALAVGWDVQRPPPPLRREAQVTEAQIKHLEQHQATFEYGYIEDLYERVCSDLGITPVA